MLKLAEIKDMSTAEISEQIKKSRLELVDLKMKFASRQLENPSQIKKKRKEIARILTFQTQLIAKKDLKSEEKKPALRKTKKTNKEDKKGVKKVKETKG